MTTTNRIKELRTKQGKTLRDVAKAVNTSNQNISNWERGKSEPKLETWKKLADYFGVSMAYLQNVDDFFDTQNKNSVHDNFQNYRDYLKKRGQGLNKQDEPTLSSYAQFQLNQLDNAFNWGNTSLRALPDNEILDITDVFENLYVSFFNKNNEKSSSFYKEYLKMLKTISELTITLNIVDEFNASDTFKKHIGFDRSDITKILKDINNELVPKTNIASNFDVEKGKFWDNEKEKYTDDIPTSSDLSQAEKWIINKRLVDINKKASDDEPETEG